MPLENSADPTNASGPRHNPIRLGKAWQALKRLVADPDRTDQVFIIIESLSGNSGERQYQRFIKTPVGRQILDEERDILALLNDREALHALPDGTLGKAYATFMDAEQISADGLVGASEEGRSRPVMADKDRLRFSMRLRDSHDLWHVATGHNRDLVGEAMLLGFTYAQLRNPGIGVIVFMALLQGGKVPGSRKMIIQAYKRGRKAAWLPAADWEKLVTLPLEKVRAQLGLEDLPQYEELRSEEGKLALEAREVQSQ